MLDVLQWGYGMQGIWHTNVIGFFFQKRPIIFKKEHLADAKCRQKIRHVLSASIAQAFVFNLGEKRFKLGTLYSR